jgi:uncharacterized protein with FMN-binding domain
VRRITTAIVATISGVALLFSYHTSTNGSRAVASAPALVLAGRDATGTVPSATQQPATDAAPAATTDPPAATTDPPPATTAGSGSASTAPKVVDGDSIDTRWGPVQVQVTVAGGKITDVQPLVVPYDNGKSQEINNYAVPILRQEIIDAQSAQIDTVSGATYTSGGYRDSLQSALDKIGFAS